MDDSELLAIMSAKISPARGGRRPSAPLTIGTPRELTEADLHELIHPSSVNSQPLMTQKLRSTHHRLAQLIASGMKQVDASLITGYSQSRISTFMQDPGFLELVANYKNQKDAVFVDAQERLAALCITATEILQERMEENPEGISVRELNEIIAETGDRSIAPKKNMTKIDQNVTLSWANIVEESIKKANPPKTIENAAE